LVAAVAAALLFICQMLLLLVIKPIPLLLVPAAFRERVGYQPVALAKTLLRLERLLVAEVLAVVITILELMAVVVAVPVRQVVSCKAVMPVQPHLRLDKTQEQSSAMTAAILVWVGMAIPRARPVVVARALLPQLLMAMLLQLVQTIPLAKVVMVLLLISQGPLCILAVVVAADLFTVVLLVMVVLAVAAVEVRLILSLDQPR
jgi:hypothetical protein